MRLYEIKQEEIFHVTHTDRLPSIMKKGLIPMQKSNWIQAGNKERYGSGEIFAFTNKQDAIRWAARMDWEFNKEIGSGNVSILTIKDSGEDWEIDDADPLSQVTNKGKWIKKFTRIKPEQIVKAEPINPSLIRSVVFKITN